MPLLGQASGGWTESSSALRILHVGIRNSVGVLTTDAFTQVNPVCITGTTTTSAGFDGSVLGILSGSVAYTRPDGGSNEIGGPSNTGQVANLGAGPVGVNGVRPLGVFINTAAGNDFENQPAVASDKGPYVSGQGTYGNSLFETNALAVGHAALTYGTGDLLFGSVNGFLTNEVAARYEAFLPSGAETYVIGVCKMPNDIVQPELVYDQRI